MSTAHRPTWTPKVGGDGLKDGAKAPPTFSTSSKEQKSHTKLKLRKPEQLLAPKPADILLLNENEETFSGDDNSFDSGSEDEESNEEDEELLRLELEKIRKEREDQRRRDVQAKKIQEQIELNGNPLLPTTIKGDTEEDEFSVKRRWNDDAIFQVKHTKPDEKKRFVNDTTKSDFHRRFMDKYIR